MKKSELESWLSLRCSLACAAVLLLGNSAPGLAQTVLDNFDTRQGPLSDSDTLVSTQSGGMLGGERDLELTVSSGAPVSLEVKGGVLAFSQDPSATASANITWDGADSDASSLNTTGLGSIDLTAGGQDSFLLGVNSCSQSVNVTLVIYSPGGTRSATISIAPSSLPMVYRISFSAFAGTGSFTAAGAVRMAISSSPGADLKIDFLRTDSTGAAALEATLTDIFLVDNDGNGVVSAGDKLRYVVRITNNDATAKTGVQFNALTPAHTTLGAVNSSPVARDDGPSSTSSAPGEAFHGSFNTPLNTPAGAGLLANDFAGSPAASITSFGGGSLGGNVGDHGAGTSASTGGNQLTVHADGSFSLVPDSTFTGLFTFQYRLVNSHGSSDATATIAIGVRPAANADTYAVTGNVGNIQPAGSGVIQKGTPDTGDRLSVTTFGASVGGVGASSAGSPGLTANGGNLILNSDGSFSYDPPPGSTASDSFAYKVDNGFNQPSIATVTLTISDMVWFIDNSGAAPGNGRLSSPFNSLAAFVAVNDGTGSHPKAGDSIYIASGIGSYSGTTAVGLSLLAGQKLIGQGANAADLASATGITFASGSISLPALNGMDPVIVNSTASGNGITLAANNTVRGLTVGNTPNGFGFIGGAVGNVIIRDCSKLGSGGALSITSSGAFGSNVSFDAFESTSSPGANLNLVNVTGTLAVTSPGSGFAASAAAAPAISISGGSVTLTYEGNVAKGNGNALLSVSGSHGGTLIFQAGTLTASAGTGLQFSNAGGSYSFLGTTILNGGDAGVDIISNSSGTFNFGASTTVTSPTGIACQVNGGSPSVSFAGSIVQNNAQRVVTVDSTTSGTVTFSGSVTGGASSTGILINNANGNVTFSSINLGTSGARINNQALTITGGSGSYNLGAVSIFANNVTGISALNADGAIQATSGTVDAGQGTAITIDGPAGLTTLGMTLTKVVSSGGSATGIILQDANGSFTVNGDGSNTSFGGNGSGGTLASKSGTDGSISSGNGVYLRNVSGITLRRMQLNDAQNFAVRGAGVTGFTLEYCTINGANGTTTVPVVVDGYTVSGEGSVSFTDLLGSASLTSSLIRGGVNDNVTIVNTAGSLNALGVQGCTIRDNHAASGNDGIHIEAQSTASIILNIGSVSTPNTFTANRGDHIQVSTLSTTASVVLNFIGNTLSGGHAAALGQGVTLDGIGTTTYTISNNTINGAIGVALNATMLTGGTQLFTGTIANNAIGTAGTLNSGSAQGNAIVVELNGDGTHSATISGNTLRQWGNGAGLLVQKRNSSSAGSSLNVKITGNTIANPGSSAGNGILVNSGTSSGHAGTTCADIGGAGGLANTLAGSGVNGSTDFRIRQRFNTTVRLPGYGGSNTDDAAVVAFVQGRNSGSPTGSATHDTTTGGGGFVGGAACSTP